MSNVKSLNSGLYLLFVKLFPELRLSCTGSFYIYLKTSLVIMQEKKKMTVPFFFERHICFFMIYIKKITLTQFLGKLGFFLGIHHHKAYIFMF